MMAAGAALVASLLGSSGLPSQGSASLLLAFAAVIALTLTQKSPR